MKRIFWLLAAACFLLAASGCTPIQTNISDLLDAPRLTERQGQVLEALRDEVGQDIKLKYPKSGEYRSAFTFYDIDGDGSDEAIVLYAVQDSGRQVTRVAVLDDEAGGWQAVGSHIPGLGTDIDFIRFEQMKSSGPKSMIIGWVPEGTEKSVAVYRYDEGGFRVEYSEDYSQIGIGDLNGNGLHELLLLCAPDTGAIPYVILAGEDENRLLDTLDEVLLDDRILSFLEPVCGVASADGLRGVVVDCMVSGRSMATCIIQVKGNSLAVPTADNDNALFYRTYRTTGVRSEDVNGDGIIEIPLVGYPYGQDEVEESARVFYTDYMQLEAVGLREVQRAYVNVEQGYRMTFPDSWLGEPEVSIRRLQENGEVIFFIPRDAAGESITELLRIRVGDSQGYPDKLETKSYFVIRQRGVFSYYAWLPEDVPQDLAMTKELLDRLFTLIS